MPDQPDTDEKSEAGADAPHLVVVIGASAGGLKPLQIFFSQVEINDHVSYVVLQHSDPDVENRLPDLIARESKVDVTRAEEGTRITSGSVQIITNSYLRYSEDGFREHRPENPKDSRARHWPIDNLLLETSRVFGDRVAAIILSGTGHDGTRGLKAVKESGGLVLVQDPDDAEYQGMPRSAMDTGLVDVVAPAEDLVERLNNLVAGYSEGEPASFEESPEDEEKYLTRVLDYLRLNSGKNFHDYKISTVRRRIWRRIQLHGLCSLKEYEEFLRDDDGEHDILSRDLLISVTRFFRDTEFFEHLRDKVLPEIVGRHQRGDELRIWVAGCATGEEAYSIGMLACEELERQDHSRSDLRIFATDLQKEAIQKGRRGSYPLSAREDIPSHLLKKYFTVNDSQIRVLPALKDVILFAAHDVTRNPPFLRMDLISCRNLLIYLEKSAQQRVLQTFQFALKQEGLLVLGTSESTDSSPRLFRRTSSNFRVYRPNPYNRREVSLHLPEVMSPKDVEEHTPPRGREERALPELHKRLMMERYAPPSILVDEDYRILHLFGGVHRFLRVPAGVPGRDLLEMIIPHLKADVRTGVYAALKDGETTVVEDLQAEKGNGEALINLIVEPVRPDEHRSGPMAMVIFEERAALQEKEQSSYVRRLVLREQRSQEAGDSPPPEPADQTLIDRLQDELTETRERLQSVVEEYETSNEELRSSNEELQSMNEELRSTTEELEVSREELQSANVELTNVNEQLKSRIEDLRVANEDMEGLVRSVRLASLFLDQDLCIERFTPEAGRLFDLEDEDCGRPAGQVVNLLKQISLKKDSREVMDSDALVEREVRNEEGRTWVVRLTPYRTDHHKAKGVVITFLEITARLSAEEEVRRNEELLRRAVDNSPYPAVIHDEDGRIHLMSSSLVEMTGIDPEKVTTTTEWIQSVYPEATDDVRERIHDLFAIEKRVDEGLFVLHPPKGGKLFWQWSSAPIGVSAEGKKLVISMGHDVTRLIDTQDQLRELTENLETRVEEKTEHIRELATSITLIQQRERRQLAEILHDNLQQLLYSLLIQVEMLSDPAQAPEATGRERQREELMAVLQQAIGVTRDLTVDLSPPVLRGEGLATSLQWLARQMERLHHLNVELRIEENAEPSDPEARVLLYSIIRELLFNVVKHSGVHDAKVSTRLKDDTLEFIVADDGKGFEPEELKAPDNDTSGFGLYGIRERLTILGGSLKIESIPGDGSRIVGRLPLVRR